MKPMKNVWGAVKPYSRHTVECPHRQEKDYNDCRCPKWVYVNAKGQEPRRYSLSTPSWAEALRVATDTLEALNPEIAAARKQKVEEEAKTVTVQAAINQFLASAKARTRGGTSRLYRGLLGYRDEDGVAHGRLLQYAEANRVKDVREFTPMMLEAWYTSPAWEQYAPTSRRQRWTCIRLFFKYLFDLGVIPSNPAEKIKSIPSDGLYHNIPFTPERYEHIRSTAERHCPERIPADEARVYARRMLIFVELLRWTGMDVCDGVRFQKNWIDQNGVLTYRRTKTGTQGIIPLEPHLVELLKEIPLAPDSVQDMPFRTRSAVPIRNATTWSNRFRQLLKAAGINTVTLRQPDGSILEKAANMKALRHTFAVHYLSLGLLVERVAKMLGHRSTATTEKHYAVWCKQMNDAHIAEVRAVQAAQQQKPTS